MSNDDVFDDMVEGLDIDMPEEDPRLEAMRKHLGITIEVRPIGLPDHIAEHAEYTGQPVDLSEVIWACRITCGGSRMYVITESGGPVHAARCAIDKHLGVESEEPA